MFFILLFLSAGVMLAGNGLVLYNANVIDTQHGRVLYNHTVSISEGKLVSVEPSRGRIRRGELDMTGKFIMPGLIDSHVHFANACKTETSACELAGTFLKNGVTTVRDVGGNYLYIRNYNGFREQGSFAGPEIYYSAIWAEEPFDMPSVHADMAESENNPWSRIFSVRDSTDAAIETAVMEAVDIGCTGFKLYINYSAEDLSRVIPVMRKHGMKVWGHSSQINGAGALEVARSGIEVMSHAYLIPRNYYPKKTLSAQDREYVSDVLDEMLGNGVVLDMTVKLSYGSGTYFASEVASMAYKKGLRFVVGTDLPGCEIHNEIDVLSKECGIGNADILRAVTVTGADILGQSGCLGIVAPGAQADIIVLEGNPLEDLSELRNVVMTIADGNIVYSRFSSET